MHERQFGHGDVATALRSWLTKPGRELVDRIIEDGAAETGVLAYYVDFKERGEGEQLCRWNTCEWWSAFLDWAGKVRLCGTAVAKTIDSVKEWLRGQVAPSVNRIPRMRRAYRLADADYRRRERFCRRHVQLLGEAYARYVLAANDPTPI